MQKLCSFHLLSQRASQKRARHQGLAGGCEVHSARTHNTNCIKLEILKLGVPPLGRVLGMKVLLRAGVCRPGEKLARSITSLAPALTLTTPCLFVLRGKSVGVHSHLNSRSCAGHVQGGLCVFSKNCSARASGKGGLGGGFTPG